MKLLLKLLALFLNALPKTDWQPIPLCNVYYRYGLEKPNLVGHNTAPTVTTGSASNIAFNNFDMGGNITDTGNVNPTVRGFVYVVGSGGTPTTADSVVNESGSFGTGSYSLNISGLSGSTTYSVRAYATNVEGTGYGSTVEVTTANSSPTTVLNTPADTAIDISTTPTLEFTGTDAEGDDVRYNVQVFQTEDSYAFSNSDSSAATMQSSANKIGQIFYNEFASELHSASFNLSKTGSPPGDVVAELFASTGTPGTNASGTGSVLATSDSLSISGLSSSESTVEFTFSGANRVSLSADTWYYIGTRTQTSGDSSNRLLFHFDGSSSTHSGNMTAYIVGSWSTVFNADDAVFEVKTGINKVSGTDSGFANTVTPADTDPFNSGEKADYDVQPADELTASTTYYWRVRGIDPSGSNEYGAWSSTRSFTTDSGSTTLVTQGASWGFTADSTTINQNHVLASNGTAFGFTSDNTTITQNHIVASNDSSFAFTATNTTIDETHILATQGATFGFTADSTTINQNHIIQTADGSWGFTADATTVEETNFVLDTQGSTFAFTADNTTITQNHIVGTGGAAWAFTADATTIDQTQVLATNDATFGFSVDSATISQNHVVETQGAGFGFTVDTTTINQNHILSTNGSTWGFSADATTIDQNHVIATDGSSFTFSADTTTLDQNHVVGTGGAAFGFTADNTTLNQNHVVASNDSAFGFTADNATLDLSVQLQPNGASFGFTADGTTIEQNHVISTDGATFGFGGDSSTIGQDHVLEVQSATWAFGSDTSSITQDQIIQSNDAAFSFTADSTTINQNHVLSTNGTAWGFTLDTTTIEQDHVLASQDATWGFGADNTTVSSEDIQITVQSAGWSSQQLPSIMLDTDGNAYKRLDSNLLVKL